MLEKLHLLNFEVTQRCSLKCPECFCEHGTLDMDINVAKKIINDALPLGLRYLNISGGEPLMYPYLFDLVEYCNRSNILTNIAISGKGFTPKVLESLISAGIYGIFVSLNGVTKKTNKLSRDGFESSIKALHLLSTRRHHVFTAINWVMRCENTEEFPLMVKIAEENQIRAICILLNKKNFHGQLKNFPSKLQIHQLCKYIKSYHGPIHFEVDSCFSQFKAVYSDWLLGNNNTGKYRGCRAGIDGCAVKATGEFAPCLHIPQYEQTNSILEYWKSSSILRKLRVASTYSDYCTPCKWKNFCRPCIANAMIENQLSNLCNDYCSLR